MKAIFSTALALCLLGVIGREHALAQAAVNPLPDASQPGVEFSQVMSYLKSQISPADTGEGGGMTKLGEFESFWAPRVSRTDSSGRNMFARYMEGALRDAQHKQVAGCATGGYQGRWTCIGPHHYPDKQKMAYVEQVWADPADATGNTVLAGTNGGLFKTTDGGGSWKCLTDNSANYTSANHITDIGVHPQNSDTIYLGTSNGWIYLDRVYYGGNPVYGAGLLYTTNGGQTWNQEFIPKNPSQPLFEDTIRAISQVAFSPDGSKLYAIRGDSVFWRAYPTGTWQNITPPGVTDGWGAIRFRPGSGDFVLSSFVDGPRVTPLRRGRIVYCTVSGSTHTYTDLLATLNIPAPNSGAPLVGDSVSDTRAVFRDGTRLLCAITGKHNVNTAQWGTAPQFKLVEYNLSTNAWSFIRFFGNVQFAYGNFNWGCGGCFGYEVSATDPNRVYFRGEYPYISLDGGLTLDAEIGEYGGSPTHGDVRDIFIHTNSGAADSGRNDIVFLATDGGVSIKRANRNPVDSGVNSTENMSQNGPPAHQFYSIATSEEGNIKMAGSHHNGVHAHEPFASPAWAEIGGGDTWNAYFERTNRRQGVAQTSVDSRALDKTVSSTARVLSGFGGSPDLPNIGHFEVVPFAVDDSNHHFASMERLVERTGADGNWNPSPPVAAGLPVSLHIKIIAMDFVPTSQSTIDLVGYVAHENNGLFYRNPVAGLPFQYQFNQLGYPDSAHNGITDITLDHQNPQRVWLARRNLQWHPTARNRVSYSTNGGTTWRDISKGLPAHIPVTSIVYQQASPYIYAATDVGIYRCDLTNYSSNDTSSYGINQSVQWACFSKGAPNRPDFPNVITTDLQINYCAGTLLASTLGRSIWETPLWNWDTYHPSPTTTITANTTWSGKKYLTGSVVVKSGKTLTISTPTGQPQTVIHMPSEGYIHVEPGATLIVNNARLTNACKDCFWKGIEAAGKTWQTIGTGNARVQSPQNVGTVIITGSTIEHARNAVCNYAEVAGGLDSVGGVIQVAGTTFRNNRRSLCWIHYEAQVPGSNFAPAADRSYAKLCTFDIDDDWRGYANGLAFGQHASLDRVYGVSFYGNTFTNHSTYGANKGAGNGIHSTASQIKVVPECSASMVAYPGTCPAANVVPNRFSNLHQGIYANGAMSFLSFGGVAVDSAMFDSVAVGIHFDGAELGSVVRSTFKVGNSHLCFGPQCNQNIGIYAKDGDFSRIEENKFTGVSALSRVRFGVVAENVSTGNNEVYKCKFEDLDYACFAKGVNGQIGNGANSYTGLSFLCNAYSGNDTDIVAYGHQTNANLLAIRQTQGTAAVGAGNTYPANGGVIRYYGMAHPQYYHNNGTSKPVSYVGFSLGPAYDPPACTSKMPTGSGGGGGGRISPKLAAGALEEMENNFLSNIAAAKNQFEELMTLLDGGATGEVLEKIESATSSNADKLYDLLLGNAPYSSEGVLRQAVIADVMSLEQTMDVLLAHPDVLRAPGFMNFLEKEAPSEFPGDALEALHEALPTITERGEAELVIGDHTDEAYRLLNQLSGDLAFDTSLDRTALLPGWYNAIPEPWAKLAEAAHHSTRGAYDEADSTYARMARDFTLTEQQSAELAATIRIDTMLRNLRTSGTPLAGMTSAQLALLTGIVEEQAGTASATAGKLLSIAMGAVPDNCIAAEVSPSVDLRRKRGNRFAGTAAEGSPRPYTANRVDATPNPASETVSFRYYLPVRKGAVQLIVTDAAGRAVYRANLEGSEGQTGWDVRSLSPGTYLYSVRAAGRSLGEGKIVVQR